MDSSPELLNSLNTKYDPKYHHGAVNVPNKYINHSPEKAPERLRQYAYQQHMHWKIWEGVFYAVFDLDNCISDDMWRKKFIRDDKEGDDRFKLYHSLCEHDQPSNLHWLPTFHSGIRASVLTSRPESMMGETVEWLGDNLEPLMGRPMEYLWMRSPGDTRPPAEYKKDRINTVIAKAARYGSPAYGRNIRFFDDDPDVINMLSEYNSRILGGSGIASSQITVDKTTRSWLHTGRRARSGHEG